MNLEFIKELRDLCDKHLAAEAIGDAPAKPAKKTKPADDAPLPEPTQEDVRAAMINYSKKHGKENTFKLLLAFGAKTVSEINKKDYKEILGKAKL